MKPTNSVLPLLVAAAFSFCSMAALATPKAAEHEDAPVTTGADVARPKLSAKPAKHQVAGKTKPATRGKPVNATKSLKKAKLVPGRK